MERNIKSEVDIFLDDLKIGIILKSSNKIREIFSKEIPKIKDINKIKQAMQLHKLAHEVLKEENTHIAKEMSLINKSKQLNNAMMPTEKHSIYKIKA